MYSALIDFSVDKSLKEAPVFKDIVKPIVKTVYSKGRAMSSLVYKQRNVTLTDVKESSLGKVSGRCTSQDEAASKRGPKCKLCPMMSGTSTATINGVEFKLEGGNCKDRNVIYLFQCIICTLAYVGKTDQLLHKRNNGHRTCGLADCEVITDFQALHYHATVTHGKNFDDIYKVWVVKKVDSPCKLLHWEQFFY